MPAPQGWRGSSPLASDFFRKRGGFLYNRYIRGDDGIYTRVPMDDAPRRRSRRAITRRPSAPPPQGAPERGFFNDLLEKLHLGDLDAGDLLLLFSAVLSLQAESRRGTAYRHRPTADPVTSSICICKMVTKRLQCTQSCKANTTRRYSNYVLQFRLRFPAEAAVRLFSASADAYTHIKHPPTVCRGCLRVNRNYFTASATATATATVAPTIGLLPMPFLIFYVFPRFIKFSCKPCATRLFPHGRFLSVSSFCHVFLCFSEKNVDRMWTRIAIAFDKSRCLVYSNAIKEVSLWILSMSNIPRCRTSPSRTHGIPARPAVV